MLQRNLEGINLSSDPWHLLSIILIKPRVCIPGPLLFLVSKFWGPGQNKPSQKMFLFYNNASGWLGLYIYFWLLPQGHPNKTKNQQSGGCPWTGGSIRGLAVHIYVKPRNNRQTVGISLATSCICTRPSAPFLLSVCVLVLRLEPAQVQFLFSLGT